MSTVTLKHVYKVYENAEKKGAVNTKPAVSDFCLEIKDKEFIVFVGPSGCGKSTTLRMIAGLEGITDGEILIDGKVVNDVAPKDRDIAMVFQNYALYPHMSVYDNMAFGLKLRKYTKKEIDEKVRAAAKTLAIEEYLKRKPKALSGGQRQRVAIGRAMVRDSKVFLMDEPLSNLDAKLRNQMRAEIILLRKKIDTTFIYVTHDQTEAMTLGDRIVIMKDGFIQQVGTPIEVFDMPKNLFVAEFIGAPKMNTFRSKLSYESGHHYVTAFGVKLLVDGNKAEMLKARNIGGSDIVLGVRPEHVKLTNKNNPGAIPCKIDVNEMMGGELHLHVSTTSGDRLIVRVPTVSLTDGIRNALVAGATIYVTHQPCVICAKMIINSGISRVVFKYGYPDEFSLKLFAEAGIKLEQFN